MIADQPLAKVDAWDVTCRACQRHHRIILADYAQYERTRRLWRALRYSSWGVREPDIRVAVPLAAIHGEAG